MKKGEEGERGEEREREKRKGGKWGKVRKSGKRWRRMEKSRKKGKKRKMGKKETIAEKGKKRRNKKKWEKVINESLRWLTLTRDTCADNIRAVQHEKRACRVKCTLSTQGQEATKTNGTTLTESRRKNGRLWSVCVFEPLPPPPKKCQSEAHPLPPQMSMTLDLPQCQEQRRGGAPKNVSLRGRPALTKMRGGVGRRTPPPPKKMSVWGGPGADKNEGGGGEGPPPQKNCQSEGGRGWPSRMSRTTPGQAQKQSEGGPGLTFPNVKNDAGKQKAQRGERGSKHNFTFTEWTEDSMDFSTPLGIDYSTMTDDSAQFPVVSLGSFCLPR